MEEKKSYFKSQKGITLIVFIITIIVMCVLAGMTMSMLIGPKGILTQATKSAKNAETKKMYETIGIYYEDFESSDEVIGLTDKEIFIKFREKIASEVEGVVDEEIFQNNYCIVIKTENTGYFTILKDGTVYEGITNLWLDIADGNIVIMPKGFRQTTENIAVAREEIKNITMLEDNKLTEEGNKALYIEGLGQYNNSYVITGETNEYNVSIIGGNATQSLWGSSLTNYEKFDIKEKVTYNIGLNNLNIDTTENAKIPIDTNVLLEENTCDVNIFLEGKNNLNSNSSAIRFMSMKSRGSNDRNGSNVLTIDGTGSLYAKCNGNYCATIGATYSGGGNALVNKIIINGGKITAHNVYSEGIGGGLRGNVNSIIINDGEIDVKSSVFAAIGTTTNENNGGIFEYLEINGGYIKARGGEYGSCIGGDASAGTTSGTIKITGGYIDAIHEHTHGRKNYSSIGDSFKKIEISGGTIICDARPDGNKIYGYGFGDKKGLTTEIKITGGNIKIKNKVDFCIGDGTQLIDTKEPINESNNSVYLTELSGMPKNSEIDVLEITGLSYSYGSKDLKTDEEGKLYLYLPQGTRDIIVTIKGIRYTFLDTVTN